MATDPDPMVLEGAGHLEMVTLVRHGETEWNRLGRRQGQLDSPLTADGLLHGQRVAAALAGLGIDGVFTSPLRRSLLTAQACGAALVRPVVVIDELAEVHHGEMAGLTAAEIEQALPGDMARRAANRYEWRFPGGESYADADRRAAIGLGRVAAAGGRRPLIVSHEMIGRMLLRNLIGADPATALTWHHPHGLIYRVDVANRTVQELPVDRR